MSTYNTQNPPFPFKIQVPTLAATLRPLAAQQLKSQNWNDKTTQVLRDLEACGLAPVCHLAGSVPFNLATLLCETLMAEPPPMPAKGCQHTHDPDAGRRIQFSYENAHLDIPRSPFLLLWVSQFFRLKVYLFSSKTSTHVFSVGHPVLPSIGILNLVDTVKNTSIFVPLHVHQQSLALPPRVPVPPLPRHRSTLTPIFQSDIRPTQFRSAARQVHKFSWPDIPLDVFNSALREASRRHIDDQITDAINKTLNKKLDPQRLAAALDKERNSLKNAMINAKRVKDEVAKNTVRLLSEKYEDLEEDSLFNRLARAIDGKAKTAAASAEPEPSAEGSQSQEQGCIVQWRVEWQSILEDQQSKVALQETERSGDLLQEQPQTKNQDFRTITLPLHQARRPDMMQYYHQIRTIFHNAQNVSTNLKSELSMLERMSLLKMVDGSLHESPAKSQPDNQPDNQPALPLETDTTVDVDDVDDVDDDDDDDDDDVMEASAPKAAVEHTLWTELADKIQLQDVYKVPGGYSSMFSAAARQLAVATNNLWEGVLYTKSLDIFCSRLLKLLLRPQAEIFRQHRSQQRAAERQAKREKLDKGDRARRKNFKANAHALFHDLAFVLSSDRKKSARIDRILQLLESKAQHPPPPGAQKWPEKLTSGIIEIADKKKKAKDDDKQESDETPSEKIRPLKAVMKMLLHSPAIRSQVDASWVGKALDDPTRFIENELATMASGEQVPALLPKKSSTSAENGHQTFMGLPCMPYISQARFSSSFFAQRMPAISMCKTTRVVPWVPIPILTRSNTHVGYLPVSSIWSGSSNNVERMVSSFDFHFSTSTTSHYVSRAMFYNTVTAVEDIHLKDAHMTTEDIEDELAACRQEMVLLEGDVKSSTRTLELLENTRTIKRHDVNGASGSEWGSRYDELVLARQQVEAHRQDHLKKEARLLELKEMCYVYNRILKADSTPKPASECSSSPPLTVESSAAPDPPPHLRRPQVITGS
ncbi:hypothetical protein BGX28_000138, partial [Mortierella sp. GBA30]